MAKLLALTITLLAASVLAAGNEVTKAGSSAVMKDLMKDAAGAGAGPNAQPGPDVSKMPFSQDSIRQVVAHHQPQIQACYEETLASKEKVLEGKLVTSFVITGEGMVKSAKVEKKGTTLKDQRLHDCVVAVISTMTFPAPPDGRDHPIEYPFNLKAIQ